MRSQEIPPLIFSRQVLLAEQAEQWSPENRRNFHKIFDKFDRLKKMTEGKHLVREQMIPLLREAITSESENGLFKQGGRKPEQGPYMDMLTPIMNQHIPR